MKKPSFGVVSIKPNGKQHSFYEMSSWDQVKTALTGVGPELKTGVEGYFEATQGEYWIIYKMHGADFWRALHFNNYSRALRVLKAMEEEAYYHVFMCKTRRH